MLNQLYSLVPRTVFVSGVLTGTGAPQNIAHGLGRVPSAVFYSVVGSPSGFFILALTEGAHTTTNVVMTCTAGKQYRVLAIC